MSLAWSWRRIPALGVGTAFLFTAFVSLSVPTEAATLCVAKARATDGRLLDTTSQSAIALSPVTACSDALKSCAAGLDQGGTFGAGATCEIVEARETTERVTVTARAGGRRGTETAVAPATCDVAACQRAYRTFRVSDCTYQSNAGVRRVCRKTGSEPVRPTQPVETRRQAPASCDVAACSRAYRTFRASDCTFQPNNGPRRVCTRKGGAPARTARRAPRSCDVAACSRAYRTFRASDCTFQPNNGPRRVCTRTGGRHSTGRVQVFRPTQPRFPGCNYAVCQAVYPSFRAADCTYRSLFGPRRYCRL